MNDVYIKMLSKTNYVSPGSKLFAKGYQQMTKVAASIERVQKLPIPETQLRFEIL